jgi:hypothetical protein
MWRVRRPREKQMEGLLGIVVMSLLLFLLVGVVGYVLFGKSA